MIAEIVNNSFGDKLMEYRFDGISEMTRFAMDNAVDGSYAKEYSDIGFCMDSWKESCDKAVKGCPERADLFAGKLAEIKNEINTIKGRIIRDVTGESIDIGAFLSGEPECFLRRDSIPAKPVIRVNIDTCYASYEEQNVIDNRGVAIASLIDELQDMGYTVEATVGFEGEVPEAKKIGRPKRYRVLCNISTNPIDIDALAYVSSTSFFRRLGFALVEIHSQHKHPKAHGYCKMLEHVHGLNFMATVGWEGYENNRKSFKNLQDAAKLVVSKVDELSNNPEGKILI